MKKTNYFSTWTDGTDDLPTIRALKAQQQSKTPPTAKFEYAMLASSLYIRPNYAELLSASPMNEPISTEALVGEQREIGVKTLQPLQDASLAKHIGADLQTHEVAKRSLYAREAPSAQDLAQNIRLASQKDTRAKTD